MTEAPPGRRPMRTCEECGSLYVADASVMAALCPECAHHLYGYAACAHAFVEGRCARCGWDSSRSPYVRRLIDDAPGPTSSGA